MQTETTVILRQLFATSLRAESIQAMQNRLAELLTKEEVAEIKANYEKEKQEKESRQK